MTRYRDVCVLRVDDLTLHPYPEVQGGELDEFEHAHAECRSMSCRASRAKPTVIEFLEQLSIHRCENPLLRRYDCTLRRRKFGQTADLVSALCALDTTRKEIALAPAFGRRQVVDRGQGACGQRIAQWSDCGLEVSVA